MKLKEEDFNDGNEDRDQKNGLQDKIFQEQVVI